MAQNSINVTATTGAPIKVNVTASGSQGTVTLSQDTSAYNAEIARQWAISDKIVLQEDYSSKYYANKSKESADSSQVYANSARETFDSFINDANIYTENIIAKSENAITDIETAKADAVGNITTARDESIASVEAKSNEVLSTVNTGIAEINTTKTNAVNAVNNTKTTILQDIEFVADGEKQEIQDLADEIKDNGDTINTAINAGVERLNSIDALKKSQITNCLLEVPQRIKLELNNGILTLKAGSEVIVPNGFEEDGTTPKFDYVTIESDVLFDFSGWGTTKRTLTFNTVQQKLEGFERETQTSSGSAVPAVEYGYMTWYDTANNLVKYSSDSGTTWSAGGSLPLAIFSGGDSVLDQVFNGFGYIGSTIWVDKGVKGLIPNGRNEDGTLNNIEYITQNVTLKTQDVSGWNGRWTAYLGNGGYVDTHPTELHYISEVKPAVWTQSAYWENPAENKLYLTVDTGATWNQVLQINIAKIIESNTKIQKLQHKNSFRAVDYSDYVNRPHIVETYVNGTSWYRVWSDGWCEQGGALHNLATGNDGNITVSYLKPFSNNSYTLVTNVGWNDDTNQSAWQQPYAKTATDFSYRKDSRYIGNWYACGY